MRGRDGQHQLGGEGVGEEDSELLEERGTCWEDQQAQAPGAIDPSYMKSPPPIIFCPPLSLPVDEKVGSLPFCPLKKIISNYYVKNKSDKIIRNYYVKYKSNVLYQIVDIFKCSDYFLQTKHHLKVSRGLIYLTKFISRNIRRFSALKPKY